MPGKLVFRLDAGQRNGFGHLSRCMNLAEEFMSLFFCQFLIKTDDENLVLKYIVNRGMDHARLDVEFIEESKKSEAEIDLILEYAGQNNFLILDHYGIDESYQLALKQKKIHWLQFDSHGRGPFYSDMVLHASPGAKEAIYKPLVKSADSRLLLGPRYAVLHRRFKEARGEVKPRQSLSKIFMCFGGGSSAPIISRVLKLLDEELIKGLHIDLLISNDPENEELETFVAKHDSIHLRAGESDVVPYMLNADLALISPGTLSYESACLGLPMLLIPFADNQYMNARGWEGVGCAVNAGTVQSLTSDRLNRVLNELKQSPHELTSMSRNCLKLVDGDGAGRVKSEVEKFL